MKFLLSLRITGEDLQPGLVTAALGMEPTKSQTKGQVFKSIHSGKERIAKFGMWVLESSNERFTDLDAEIIRFAGLFPQDVELWTRLGAKYEVDFYCGFFMGKSNDMLYLSPETNKAISRFRASITVDVYDANDQ